MKVKSFIALLLTLLTFVIAGCGDDGPKTTPFVTAPAASAASAIANDGTSTSTITATLPAGTVDGTVVTFTIISGSGTFAGGVTTITATTTTDVNGVSSASVILNGTAPGDVVVRVSSGNFASNVPPITFPAGALVVTATPNTVAINTTSVISAQLPTATPGVTVSFTMTGTGTLSAATAVTDAAGLASVTLTAPAAVGSATVTATAGLLIGNVVAITYIADPNAPGTVSLAASLTSLFVGQGPVTLTATVSAAGGAGFTVPDTTVVTFATTAGTPSAATATTVGGVASITLDSAAAITASVTASAAGIASAPVSVVFNAAPTQAIVTVALTGTLNPTARADGSFQRIGAEDARIGYSTTVGLGNPVVSRIGISPLANIFAANPAVNPVTIGHGWQDTIPPDVVPTVGTIPGNIVTLTFPIAPGNFPTAADFNVDAATTVLDDQSVSLAGVISITISVQIQ